MTKHDQAPTLTPRQQREKLDADVAAAQRAAIAPGATESDAARRRRLDADRAAIEARNDAVAAAQIAELTGSGPESDADRLARIDAAHRAVLDRNQAVIDAVAAENKRRADA
jgi:hypothetical protein